jgi:anti-sigma-K factor RskA
LTTDAGERRGRTPPEDGARDSVADEMLVLAAEFALGTADADVRANVEMLKAIDPSFAATVVEWERGLGELHALVGPVDAPRATWEWIKARIAIEPQPARLWLPTTEEIRAPANGRETIFADLAGEPDEPGPTVHHDSLPRPVADRLIAPPLIDLWRGRAQRWRRAALGFGVLAATLAAFAVVREAVPEALPEALRPAPRIVERQVETVREIPSQRVAEYVAVLQKDAGSPAFVLTMDLALGLVSVRRVSAEPQVGKDYELWLVSDKFPAPRSLGVVGAQEVTVRRELGRYDAPTLNAAVYAVSLEPKGGSPTGAPTGPLLFTGKLIQTTPAAFPAATP